MSCSLRGPISSSVRCWRNSLRANGPTQVASMIRLNIFLSFSVQSHVILFFFFSLWIFVIWKKFSIIRAECLICYNFFRLFYWLHVTLLSQYFLKHYCIPNYSPGDAGIINYDHYFSYKLLLLLLRPSGDWLGWDGDGEDCFIYTLLSLTLSQHAWGFLRKQNYTKWLDARRLDLERSRGSSVPTSSLYSWGN